MPLHRELVTSKYQRIMIDSEMPEAVAHFESQHNYADIVLDQINRDRFYDSIFEGEDDLTILDIGGNIGLFTLYAQDCAKAIYPIEPTPGHFKILTELTKDYANVHPLNYALHNEDTTIDFYISEENSTMNSTVNQYGTKVPVQARTLRSIIDELGLEKVDFIKCDIEGSEVQALTAETIGAVAELVDNWWIECHSTDPTRTWPSNLFENRLAIGKLLEDAGYDVQYVVSENSTFGSKTEDSIFASHPRQFQE
jgi:hypothetical protein